jgi:hypothetical protein
MMGEVDGTERAGAGRISSLCNFLNMNVCGERWGKVWCVPWIWDSASEHHSLREAIGAGRAQ